MNLQTTGDYKVIALLFTDGVLNWLQNIIAFSVLSLVTPLTYAVASASKRIFVIAVSLFILGNPVTWMNIFGMLLASLGVLCYNRVSDIIKNKQTKQFLVLNGVLISTLIVTECNEWDWHILQAKQLSRSQTVLPFTNESWNKYTPLPSTDNLYRNGKSVTNGGLNGYKSNNLLLNNNVHSMSQSKLLSV